MKRPLFIFSFFCFFLSINAQVSVLCDLKVKTLTEAQVQYAEGKRSAEMVKLIREAQKARLFNRTLSVVEKMQMPPSGDKHDYMTLAPYWFPDSTKENGLPYVRRDGCRNPEADAYTDKKMLNRMVRNVSILTVASVVTSDERYSTAACQLLQTWFIDTATMMNPNLRYAQAVLGRNEGRGSGIIETRVFIDLIDAIEALYANKGMDKELYTSLQGWFSQYLLWLDNSLEGKQERAARNNHGTWFTAQYARIALFVGRADLTKKTLQTLKERIAWQIEVDGKQPLELVRTKSLSYSCFNLLAYFHAFRVAEALHISMWNYATADGRSVIQALTFLQPYITFQESWPYKQIVPYKSREGNILLWNGWH